MGGDGDGDGHNQEEAALVALYRSGDMAGTASRSFAAIQDGRASPSLWVLAGQSLAVLGETALLAQLVALADRVLEPGPIFFNRVCRLLRIEKKYQVLQALGMRATDPLPDTYAMRALGCYYTGVSLVAARRLREALPWFRRFREALPADSLTTPFLDETLNGHLSAGRMEAADAWYRQVYAAQVPAMRAASPFVMDDQLNIVLRQGRLVATPDEVLALRRAPPAPVTANFTLLRPVPATGESGLESPPTATFFVSADPVYIQTFLPGFMAALARPGIALDLHVNIIDPTADALATVAALAEAHPRLRVEVSGIETRLRSSTVYSCARVFVLPELLRRRSGPDGPPLIAIDIDFAVEERVLALAREPTLWHNVDFSLFDTGRDEPASVWQASVMMLSPAPATLAFLRDVGHLCAAGADAVPRLNWMLDQAAILSALETHRAEGEALRFRPLNQILNCRLEALGSTLWQKGDEKYALRGGLHLWRLQRS